MPTRAARTFLLLLGMLACVIASSQAGLADRHETAGAAAPFVCRCCGPRHSKCPTPACCTRPAGQRAPVAPASLPRGSQNDWQALAASAAAFLKLPLPAVCDPSPAPAPSVSIPALPLFLRDCARLL